MESIDVADHDIPKAGRADGRSDGEGIRVIGRAADILNTLGRHPEGLTLREIANRVNIPRSTVQRIVRALDDANLVIAASPASGFRLGPALTSLADGVAPSDIAQICRPLMRKLNNECGETIVLAMLGSDKAVVIDHVPGVHHLIAVASVGDSLPLHASAAGKALMAALTSNDLAALRRRYRLLRHTGNTITDWAQLDPELDAIRRHAIAYDEEECFPGVRSIAGLVHGPRGECGAVSIAAPSERFEATRNSLVRLLRRGCENLQRRFPQTGTWKAPQSEIAAGKVRACKLRAVRAAGRRETGSAAMPPPPEASRTRHRGSAHTDR